jgi:hypothetical protein
MALQNYGELKAAIASFAHRTDLANAMDLIVGLATSRIAKDLRSMAMEYRSRDTITSAFHPTPNDYIELRNLHIEANGNRYRLNYLPPEQIDYEYGGAASGMPKAFTIFDSQIEFRPAPDTSYDVEIYYFAKPNDLEIDTDTNVALTNHPEVYLYACLMEVAIYLEDDNLLQKWGILYDREIAKVNSAANRAHYPNGNLQQRRG